MRNTEEALDQLLAGNRRFRALEGKHPHEDAARRRAVLEGQRPVAAVLGCSDARVPPTLVFDQGLGDLFVVRVAGTVPGRAALGSLEFAARVLEVPLIVVLGHTRCGAVEAAASDGEVSGHLERILSAIRPAVGKARGMPGDFEENTVIANTKLSADRLLSESWVLHERVSLGRLGIVSALYDLATCEVRVLSRHGVR